MLIMQAYEADYIYPGNEVGGITLNKGWFSDKAEQRRIHQRTLLEAGRLKKMPESLKTGLTGILYLGAMVSRYVEVEPVEGIIVDSADLEARNIQQRAQARRWVMRPRISESGVIGIWIGRPEILIEDLESESVPLYFGNYQNKLSKEPSKNLAALIRNEIVVQQVGVAVET